MLVLEPAVPSGNEGDTSESCHPPPTVSPPSARLANVAPTLDAANGSRGDEKLLLCGIDGGLASKEDTCGSRTEDGRGSDGSAGECIGAVDRDVGEELIASLSLSESELLRLFRLLTTDVDVSGVASSGAATLSLKPGLCGKTRF